MEEKHLGREFKKENLEPSSVLFGELYSVQQHLDLKQSPVSMLAMRADPWITTMCGK
jgi:hypothetical protein